VPPRSASFGYTKSRPTSTVPNAPNSKPPDAEGDRGYIRSEVAPLQASIWGQNSAEDSMDKFSLIWSQKQKVWFAIYRLAISVGEQMFPLRCVIAVKMVGLRVFSPKLL
jgi:hypothetical protein